MQTRAQDVSLTGIPRGLVYWNSLSSSSHVVGISLEVNGQIIPVSAAGVGGYEYSIQSAQMLAMVAAAIQKQAAITVQGTYGDDSPPDASYPSPDIRIHSIEVFGYQWGPSYLSK
jgi:hypothetical protein